MGLHSEKYAKTVYDQVAHDSGQAGFGDSSIALFGKPGTGKFEFVLTGRHCTRRCDGDSVEGTAFGGPIFYGHAAEGFVEHPDHPLRVVPGAGIQNHLSIRVLAFVVRLDHRR